MHDVELTQLVEGGIHRGHIAPLQSLDDLSERPLDSRERARKSNPNDQTMLHLMRSHLNDPHVALGRCLDDPDAPQSLERFTNGSSRVAERFGEFQIADPLAELQVAVLDQSKDVPVDQISETLPIVHKSPR